MKYIFNYQPINEDDGTTLLTSATRYRPHNKPWLTTKAESIAWAIFAPNWKDLAESPAEELENLVAQSIGLDPVFGNCLWVLLYAIPSLEKKGAVEKCNKLKEFIRRAEVAEKNLNPFGELTPIPNPDKDKKPRFNRVEFMAFAEIVYKDIPPEFRPHSSPNQPTNQSNDELTPGRSGGLSETKENNKATKGARDNQILYICKTAKELDYIDLLNIPEGGRAAIKAKCLQNTKVFTNSNFKRAWAEADKRELIRMADKGKYF